MPFIDAVATKDRDADVWSRAEILAASKRRLVVDGPFVETKELGAGARRARAHPPEEGVVTRSG